MKQKGQEGDGGMPLLFVKEDITKMKVDAIVNAANTELRMGSGVCGTIFHAAGEEKMTEACQKLSPIRTGEAVMEERCISSDFRRHLRVSQGRSTFSCRLGDPPFSGRSRNGRLSRFPGQISVRP